MDRSTFFNIGFRSDKIYHHLKDVSENKKKADPAILEKGLALVKDALKIQDTDGLFDFEEKKGYTNFELHPLIFDMYADKKTFKEIIEDIEKVKAVLEALKRNEKADNIPHAKRFFEELEDLCLYKSNMLDAESEIII